MSDETTPKSAETDSSEPKEKPAKPPRATAEGATADEKPARAPKKEKAPALEDKPFADFITQDYMPGLTKTLSTLGVTDLDLKLEQQKIKALGSDSPSYWQVIGHWQSGQRKFCVIFSKDDIQAPKYFSMADSGSEPSLLESFMIDERKVTLDLMLLYTVQRLNGQKWLVRN